MDNCVQGFSIFFAYVHYVCLYWRLGYVTVGCK